MIIELCSFAEGNSDSPKKKKKICLFQIGPAYMPQSILVRFHIGKHQYEAPEAKGNGLGNRRFLFLPYVACTSYLNNLNVIMSSI